MHTRNHAFTPEYGAWNGMKTRCLNKSFRYYSYYGGRGISVCERWLRFENFLADMGLKPKPKSRYSLDRIDTNGNYEPGNCRWATDQEQSENRRSTKRFDIDGQRFNMKQLSEHVGVPYKTFHRRLKAGWSPVAAMCLPRDQYTHHCIIRGTINPYIDGHLTRIAAGTVRHPKTRAKRAKKP